MPAFLHLHLLLAENHKHIQEVYRSDSQQQGLMHKPTALQAANNS
jgi:hypothetical protein